MVDGGVDAGVEETATLDTARRSRSGSAHLLVVEDGATTIVPLANPGILTIGRTPDVDLRLEHASVSRRHARIFVDRGGIKVSDLESHNGTRVNGVRIEGTRALTSGDVLSIGEVVVIVHDELTRELPHVILDETSWRRRLGEEVERATQFHRPLAVLAIAGGFAGAAVRTIDVLGRSDDEQQTLVLLPEADLAAAQAVARAISQAMVEARIGLATCPSDAIDADNLMLAARAAATVARPGQIATVADSVQRRELGERTVIVCHPAMVRVFDLLERLAASQLPVLIIGETGAGKENAAFAVHHHSARAAGPFVAVNCATLDGGLVESQLFGHDKGAFTGAVGARPGVFEAASGGTLFLDEIGELPLAVQAKLLRALETKRITRLGETREREVDVRIVAATNRTLDAEIAAGDFRQDLYFRIGAARVHLPPLRERRCEIPILFRELVELAARATQRDRTPSVTPEAMERLLAHRWPGNVRELRSAAEYALAATDDDRIEASDLPDTIVVVTPVTPPVIPARMPVDPGSPMRRLADEIEDLERLRMTEAMAKTGGVKTRAAALLGMPIRTFNQKFKQYGLER